MSEFSPVTIADLANENASISVHCRTCGHWATVEPASLPESIQARPVPSLDYSGALAALGRDTCAMPLYAAQKRAWRKSGEGWIMPPGE